MYINICNCPDTSPAIYLKDFLKFYLDLASSLTVYLANILAFCMASYPAKSLQLRPTAMEFRLESGSKRNQEPAATIRVCDWGPQLGRGKQGGHGDR